MDIVFLDANVLFSAAYRERSGILTFWTLKNIKLITSQYAFEEAKRNLSNETQQKRLQFLIAQMEIQLTADDSVIPANIKLRDKDRPILAAAINAHANYLITGDVRDFGCFYGKQFGGVTILSPSDYLKQRSGQAPSIIVKNT